MELAIPLVALTGLYVSTKHNNDKKIENFENYQIYDDICNEETIENDVAELSNNNEYVHGNFNKDKYFNGSAQKVFSKLQDNSNKPSYSLTGEEINTDNFKHNNMKPYFGSKIRGNGPSINTSESILDNKIGTGSQSIKKQEQAPLFKPMENVQFPYGAPNSSEFYKSRVNPSNKYSNVKPFESIQVSPGLNQGFENKQGFGGYNSALENRDTYMPKSVDELRVKTNPKNTFELSGHEGPAHHYNKHISDTTHQGKVEKYMPDTFYENTSDRWFTTTGIEKGTTARSKIDMRDVNRISTTRDYTGIANGNVDGVNYHNSNYQESRNNVYGSPNIGVASAQGNSTAQSNDYSKTSYKSYITNRDNHSESHMFGNITTAVNAAIAPIMDILRPSRKENTLGNSRLCGNIQNTVEKPYYVNYNDKPRVTNRQMDSINTQPQGNIERTQNGGYMNAEHQPVYSSRSETTRFYTGAGSSAHKEVVPYDSAYAFETNPFKEESLVGRSPNGNTSMLNHNVNLNVAKSETDRNNNRMWVPSDYTSMPPSKQTIGITDAPQYSPQVAQFNEERIDPGLLDAFKANPYTHSLSSI